MEQSDQSLTAAFFRELLKAKRRKMKPRQRIRARLPRAFAWLYPLSVERKYRKELAVKLRAFTGVGSESVRALLERWLQEGKHDAARADD